VAHGLLIEVKTTAKLLNVPERMVYRMADQKLAPGPVRSGALVRWRLTEIIEWVDSGCPSRWQWPRLRKDRR
jgi:predicted DNA-binding transcriptional regulator AlpA